MHHTSLTGVLLVLSALALSPTSSAQGSTFPPGLETKDANFYSNYLGRYRDMRFQSIYGGLQGSNKVLNFTSLELRRETTSGFTNFGRTWSNVKLSVGNADYKRLSDTFAANLASPTMVFSASVSWPDTSGKPTTVPAKWGEFVAANDMKFPFGTGGGQSTFLHDGKLGFAVDFEMQGGVLANSSNWGSTTGISYYHDGFATNNQYSGGVYTLSNAGSGCTNGYFVSWLFADRTVGGGTQFRGQLFMDGGEPSTVHFGIIGVENYLTAGLPIFASCNKLWLDISVPTALFPYTTDSRGAYYSPFITSKYRPNAVGLRIDMQAAYEDSNNVIQLSRAGRSPITALPTGTPVYFASRLYVFGGVAPLSEPVGYGPYATRVPVVYMR